MLTIPTEVEGRALKTNLVDLLFTIDVYCDNDADCVDDSFVDLIAYVSGEEYPILAGNQSRTHSFLFDIAILYT